MSWIKLDDQWLDHPKIVAAGRDARDMWLASITYCAKHLTDGFFHPNLLPALAVMAGVDVANCQNFARVLLDVGLWDRTEAGYCVHDYLDYNPSKEQADATKLARSEAGKRGADAKHGKNPGKSLANSWQNSAPSPSPSPSPSPDPNPSPSPSPSESPETTATAADYNFGALCAIYEKNIGMLSPMVSDSLQDDLIHYGLQNCMDAITEALRNNVRKWSYVQSILRRWEKEGKSPRPSLPPPPKTRKLTDAYGNIIEVPA
jgi:DnaD/phage-associated family protein